jgi:DNA mismatch repair protein MutL
MSNIKILDIELANQIAAGEVIERPASVVKELVENSIDAHSTSIDVFVYEAGRKQIRVEDNGDGMSKEDARLAFFRHATSKIKNKFDLFHISSLGFRGEALPSISSVAEVILSTSNGKEGVQVIVKNNNSTSKPYQLRKGTIVEVNNLFFNTPARLKYLKSDYTENANIIETIYKLALAHPDIAFTLFIDDKLRLKTSGRGYLKETIMNVFGMNTAKNVLPFHYEGDDFIVDGFIGNAELTKSNRYSIITNLNGRNVYMPKVQNAIIEAYADFLPPTRYPFVAMNFTIEPALVDFNVHPTKKEVRFSKEQDLRLALINEIPKVLLRQNLTPSVSIKPNYEVNDEPETKYEQMRFTFRDSTSEEDNNKPLTFRMSSSDEQNTPVLQQEPLQKHTIFENIRPVAQINLTYIICEDGEGGFYIIDQHAAMERVNYELFQEKMGLPNFTRTPLIPIIIELTPKESLLLTNERLDILKKLGISLENFGGNTYRVNEIPTFEQGYDENIYIQNVIHQVLYDDKLDLNELRKDAIATMACKASLKANQALSIDDMYQIIRRLSKTTNPYNCPHGRPTMIHYTKYELEKLFKRTGV